MAVRRAFQKTATIEFMGLVFTSALEA